LRDRKRGKKPWSVLLWAHSRREKKVKIRKGEREKKESFENYQDS